MQQHKMDITDLLADESFANYCKKSSPEDISFWENYIHQHPDQRELIALAQERFWLLLNALAQADLAEQTERMRSRLNQPQEGQLIKMEGRKGSGARKTYRLWLRISGAAVFFLAVVTFAIRYFTSAKVKTSRIFATTYGERKNIQLPDGSVVNLNAGSRIEIDDGFGVTARNIFLEGEAFFDVKHIEQKPFIVHTAEIDVMALGTAFDVKAYKEEKITETSLIRGLVQVTLKRNNNQVLLLHPNQKITWNRGNNRVNTDAADTFKKDSALKRGEGIPEKLKVTEQGDIEEIAWKESKLVFENDTLGDIARLLERWYGIRIVFQDDEIRNYRFTGVFEKEDLRTVLYFLKESKQFSFSIHNGEDPTVFLSK